MRKRLIDVELAKEAIARKCREHSDCTVFLNVMEAVSEFLDACPTVDAAEVVRGQWVNPYTNRYGHPCHCCSVCGFKASYQDKNYCPDGGAKMDGDGNGEK